MKRVLLGLAALVALAVAAVAVAVPVWISRHLTAEEVARRASDYFQRPVRVGAVGLAFRPALRVRAEGVEIEGAGSADAIEADVAVTPLLRRRLEASELHLQGPRLLVEQGAEGGYRLRLLHRRRGDPSGGLPVLPALEARDGELVIVGPEGEPRGGPVLHIRRLELARLSREGRIPARLDVSLAPGGAEGPRVEEARGEGFLLVSDGTFRIESGRLEADGIEVRRVRAERAEARFTYGGGVVEIESLTLQGYEGEGRASGRLHLARPMRFEGELSLSDVAVAALVADRRGAPPATDPGRLEAEGQVSLFLGGAERGSGRGRVSLRDGRLPARSLFAMVLGVMGQLTGRLLAPGEAVSPAPSQLEQLTASWTLREDRLHSEDLALDTDDYRYRATGSLGLDGSLAFQGPLELTARGVQRMLASAALPLPGTPAIVPDIPVRVAGTLGSPTVSARATALPRATAGALAGLVQGGAGLVQEGAGLVGDAARAGKGVVEKVFGR